MAEAPKKPAVPKAAKIAGGAVFLAASVALMIHRIPHREYVAAHADKPRPTPNGDAPAAPAPSVAKSAPAPAPVKASSAAPAKTAAAPAKTAPAPAEAAPAPRTAVASESALAPDWADDCRSELGILCHDAPEKARLKCLKGYAGALLKACRDSISPALPENAD